MINMLSSPLYSPFVEPTLCQRLHNYGLKASNYFNWVMDMDRMEATLISLAFDPDGYYAQASANVLFVNGEGNVIPAFTIEDMQSILPNWFMTRCNGDVFELECAFFPETQIQAPRIADAFALMVLKAFEEGKMDPQVSSKQLTIK